MTVDFRNLRCNDLQPPIVHEEVFRLYGAASDIHAYKFDDTYTLSEDGWSGAALPSVAAGVATLDGSALSAGWYPVINSVILPQSYLLQYTKHAYRQGAVVAIQPGFSFMVATDSAGAPTIYKKTGAGAYTAVCALPITTPQHANVVIAVHQWQMDTTKDGFWISISLYMNRRLILTWGEHLAAPMDASAFGLVVYGGDTVTYTDVRIPELTKFAEYDSLDTGEVTQSGLQRTIDGHYIQYFIRWDGSMRVWSPKSVAASGELFSYDCGEIDETGDLRQIKTHVRMVGAFIWAEAMDFELLSKYGYRFYKDDNPVLMNEYECHLQAVRDLKRMQEAAFSYQYASTYFPLIEIEDRVTTPRGSELISQRSITFGSAGITQQLNTRKYVWG